MAFFPGVCFCSCLHFLQCWTITQRCNPEQTFLSPSCFWSECFLTATEKQTRTGRKAQGSLLSKLLHSSVRVKTQTNQCWKPKTQCQIHRKISPLGNYVYIHNSSLIIAWKNLFLLTERRPPLLSFLETLNRGIQTRQPVGSVEQMKLPFVS